MTAYSTRTEAVEEIVTVIEAGDVEDARAEFDVEGIADEVIEQVATEGGRVAYEITGDVDDFWASVQRHAR